MLNIKTATKNRTRQGICERSLVFGLATWMWNLALCLMMVLEFVFADEVGLGKTIEALVVLKGMNLRKALIVVPDSLINQWKNEIDVKLWMESTIYEGNSLPSKGIILVPFEKLNKINFKLNS